MDKLISDLTDIIRKEYAMTMAPLRRYMFGWSREDLSLVIDKAESKAKEEITLILKNE